MGPTIILDKSTLQGLSPREIEILHQYYHVNFTPVIVQEILGDLSKKLRSGESSESEVIRLAKKLLPIDSAINIDFRSLLLNSLLTGKPDLDGRPVINAGIPRKTKDGKIGFFVEETDELKALRRWKQGDFTEAERLLSKELRDYSKSINLEQMQQEMKKMFPFTEMIASLKELALLIDQIIELPSAQRENLLLLAHLFQIPQEHCSNYFYRWEVSQPNSLSTFCSYATYCLKVSLLFNFGLAANLVGTRLTNVVDLQYLYYLPCTNIFSSKDKFHQDLIPYLLKPNQQFISGDVLKDDLKNIANQADSIPDIDRVMWLQKHQRKPPANEDSITFRMWNQFKMNTQDIEEKDYADTAQSNEKLMDKIRSMSKDATVEAEDVKFDNLDDSQIQFITIQHNFHLDDPCFCHSGKKFKDCHYKKIIEIEEKKKTDL